jgi:hypothetical protein
MQRLAESLRVRLHAAPFVSKNFKQFASQLKKCRHHTLCCSACAAASQR